MPESVALLADDDLGRGRERAKDGPLPAGYLEAFEEIARDARDELVVVEEAPSHRGTGMGRLLFGWVVSRARERGYRTVQLTTDKRRPDARRFYEALGFEATHEGLKLPLS